MATFFRLLLGYMWDCFRSHERLKAEIVILRHQLNILHVIIWGEAHLRHLLKAYTAYYNASRMYLGIDKDAPNRRPIERCGVIVANAVVGGLHHRYARI